MWTRAELKERAKAAFKRNYWVCVAAAVILSLLAGGGSSGGSSSDSSSSDTDSIESMFSDETDEFLSDDYGYSEYEEDDIFGDMSEEDKEMLAILGVAGGIVIIIVLVVLVISLIFGIFVSSVIEIGGCRFFTLNATQDASLKELFSGFGNGNYMRNVSTQFFRGLYTFLWSLLFLIPGIIKGYEYMMIPYILADNPDISREDAFALSKRMMDGHKWDTFVLDLSFLGWIILNAVTCGILGVFYLDPYVRATNAELYLKLKSNTMPVQTIAADQYGWDDTQRI